MSAVMSVSDSDYLHSLIFLILGSCSKDLSILFKDQYLGCF